MARYPDQTAIYSVAATFAEECLLSDGSLLWPGRSVWSRENLDSLWKALVVDADTSDNNYLPKLIRQLANQSDDVIRLMVEATGVYALFPVSSSVGPKRKQGLVQEVLDLSSEPVNPDPDRWGALLDAFSSGGIGATGTAYNTARDSQIALVLAFASSIKETGSASFAEIDPKLICDQAMDMVRKVRNYRPYLMYNILLHLFWPDLHEGTGSSAQKERMSKNLSSRFGISAVDDVDETILMVRRFMEESENFDKDFNMYSDQIRPLWDYDSKPKSPSPPEPPESPPQRGTEDGNPTFPRISDLAEITFLQHDILEDIESLLKSKKQLIFEGPPGSGKTFVAEKFARYFTGQSLTDPRNDRIELVQFHQSYSYEDFVEGIRPESKNGQLEYNVKPGIFRRFAARAANDPTQNYVLIIDEINRGNVARILGELMLLLEYRNESATLPYSQEKLEIPPNLYIIGTMNSADRSLSQIDYALRRRFYFVRFKAVELDEAPVLSGWLHQQGIEPELRDRILGTFIELNKRLRIHLETDDLQVGHSYFMHPDIQEEGYRQNVWKYAVIPLVREYLYHHRERDELLQEYELQSLLQIVQPVAEELEEPAERLVRESSGETVQ